MQGPESNTPAGVTLAHISDPHLPLPVKVPLREVLNKRLLGLLSWRTKRHRRHRPEILARLVADMQGHAPDLIMVSGDLTNLGLESEYRAARHWLDALGDASRVMTIPGNHEALVAGAWDKGAAQWQPYWQGDAVSGAPDLSRAFPVLRRRGALALIGVSSAVVSPLGFAVGEVGAAQRERLAALLRQTREEGLFRLLMIHHPPLPGTVSPRKHLRDHAEFCALLEREGVELVLHGHSHRSHHQMLPTCDGPAPVIGVPSASSMHHEPAAYHLYRIAPGHGGWQVTLRARRLGSDQTIEAGRCESLAISRRHAA
ncbi:metallophosphoesterase [uncultured Roseovarius sp.]|uniref:metallophosphoesterase family protein n=1 Tax=uncultured Roseovarius sp. TaxID=293344 RepID=UPI00260F93F1|nr:metallophosphoesterase [uncultured Roseovarius sp.]